MLTFQTAGGLLLQKLLKGFNTWIPMIIGESFQQKIQEEKRPTWMELELSESWNRLKK